MKMQVQCRKCGIKETINISKESWFRYRNGDLIQDCFPELSPNSRELLISNICGKCFDEIMGKGDKNENN